MKFYKIKFRALWNTFIFNNNILQCLNDILGRIPFCDFTNFSEVFTFRHVFINNRLTIEKNTFFFNWMISSSAAINQYKVGFFILCDDASIWKRKNWWLSILQITFLQPCITIKSINPETRSSLQNNNLRNFLTPFEIFSQLFSSSL